MAGFFKKIFGGKKKNEVTEIIEETLQGVVSRSNLNLSFEVQALEENSYNVEFFGDDEEFLKEKDGQLLDAFQLFMTRVLQHKLPEERVSVEFDCDGYREDASRELVELAEKLKGIVLAKKKSVYFRALPPKDRKVIHQYLADDERVRSRSIGEGLYKKIKIYPSGGKGQQKQSYGTEDLQPSS